ncbi:MAG: amino acid-binding protein [Propionibacteriaceae bacterium]
MQDLGVLLMRVSIPDRPGSLGAVTTAMGTVGADIHAVEMVERLPQGTVIADFMMTLPTGILPDALVSACTALEGVEEMWLSTYPESWGLESDIHVLNRMSLEPDQAAEILTDAAPVVFHCHWAILADRRTMQPIYATSMAPELSSTNLELFAPLDHLHRQTLTDGWLPHWGESVVITAPVKPHRTIILGRQGGPEWLDSEIARLRFLAGMAH